MKLIINRDKFLVKKGIAEIDLTKKEFEILWLLCSVPGKVFSRNVVFKKVWEQNSGSKIRTVDVHFVSLRKKIGHEFFKTIKGVGFKVTNANIEIN